MSRVNKRVYGFEASLSIHPDVAWTLNFIALLPRMVAGFCTAMDLDPFQLAGVEKRIPFPDTFVLGKRRNINYHSDRVQLTSHTEESMKARISLISTLGLLAAMFFIGCGTSQETTDKDTGTPPPAAVEKKHVAAAVPAPKDTTTEQSPVSTTESTPKETNTTQTQAPPVANSSMPKGQYSVQIGAFTQQQGAESRANLARTRFQKAVYLMYDATTHNTKVMIGDFQVKDDARHFRDQLVQQYPDDYKDAWVFEVPHH